MSEIESQCQVFMSLDFIQEKCKNAPFPNCIFILLVSSKIVSDPFLGLYYFLDHTNLYKLLCWFYCYLLICSYAYCSANLTKVIMVLKWDEKPPKDAFIKSVTSKFISLLFIYNFRSCIRCTKSI